MAARTSGYGLWRCNDSSPSEYPKMLSLHTLKKFLNVNFGTEGQESARWLLGGSEGQECARWRFAVALRAKNVLDGKDHGITTVRPGGCSAGLPARSCLRMPTPNVSKTFIHTSSKRRTNIQEHERIHAHTNKQTHAHAHGREPPGFRTLVFLHPDGRVRSDRLRSFTGTY